MRILSLLLALCCVMTAVVPADAREFILGLDQRLSYESNVLNATRSAAHDGTYIVAPKLSFKESGDAFSYNMTYRSAFETYFRKDNIDGWDHDFAASAERVFTGARSLSGEVAIRDHRSIQTSSLQDELTGQPTVVVADLGRVTRYRIGLTYKHPISPRLNGSIETSYDRLGYSDASSVDSQDGSAALGLRYGISPRDTVGLTVGGSYRGFEETGTRPAANTVAANGTAVYSHEFRPDLTLSLSAGPAFLRSRQSAGSAIATQRYRWRFNSATNSTEAAIVDPTCQFANGQRILRTCSTFRDAQALGNSVFDPFTADFDAGAEPAAQSEQTLTYYSNARLVKRLRKGEISLAYVRSEDASSGLGASVIRDSVDLRIRWSPARHWTLITSGNWNQQESLARYSRNEIRAADSLIPVSPTDPDTFAEADGLISQIVESAFKITQYRVLVVSQHVLSDRMSLGFTFRYIRQARDNTTLQQPTTRLEGYIGTVSFHYQFEPFLF